MSVPNIIEYLSIIIKKMNSFDNKEEGVWLNIDVYSCLVPI